MESGVTHFLKTWPEFFAAQANHTKPFEVRRYDRGYAVGDTLVLQEWEPARRDLGVDAYTGRELQRRVTYVLRDSPGLQPGYVVLGTEPWRAL
jgi:hypothetical protein